MKQKGKKSRAAAAQAAARARSKAARKGWNTRREAERLKAERHGKHARRATERRLTPSQKAARTREAHRIEKTLLHRKRSDAAKRGWETRRRKQAGTGKRREPEDRRGGEGGSGGGGGGGGTINSLDELDDYGDDYAYDDYDIETSPDYEED